MIDGPPRAGHTDLHGDDADLQPDPFLGHDSFIRSARVSARAREAGTRLNRQRASGIAAALEAHASGQSSQVDGWFAAAARVAAELGVPLVSLEALGIGFDDEDHLTSRILRPLTGGAEAKPFADDQRGVVYKLFDLRDSGALGKKILLQFGNPWEADVRMVDAVLFETMEKLAVLHEAGAHPTEIIGLADTGDYLIVKQPMAQPHGPDLDEDRRIAVAAMKALPVRGGIRGGDLRVFWVAGKAWLLGDLHRGNVMRDEDGVPTIIDALIGQVPTSALGSLPALSKAVQEAREMREGTRTHASDLFDGVNDDDL